MCAESRYVLQTILSTRCSADMIHQAVSVCQKMILLLPHDDADDSWW